MQHHLKSRFWMFRHKRLNEVIATGTYFASEKSTEAYQCVQVFFGMTSKCYLLQPSLMLINIFTKNVGKEAYEKHVSKFLGKVEESNH